MNLFYFNLTFFSPGTSMVCLHAGSDPVQRPLAKQQATKEPPEAPIQAWFQELWFPFAGKAQSLWLQAGSCVVSFSTLILGGSSLADWPSCSILSLKDKWWQDLASALNDIKWSWNQENQSCRVTAVSEREAGTQLMSDHVGIVARFFSVSQSVRFLCLSQGDPAAKTQGKNVFA